MSNGALLLLAEAVIKSSLLVAFAGLVSYFCRRQSAAVRHMVWSAAIISAVLLPLAAVLMPAWPTPVFQAVASVGGHTTSATEQSTSVPAMMITAGLEAVANSSAAEWAFFVWLGGCFVGFVVLLCGYVRLSWMASRADILLSLPWTEAAADLSLRYDLRRPVRLLTSRGCGMPLTWGFFQPRVLLPADAVTWSHERMRVVLGHELAHVKRGDWVVQMLAEMGRTLYWFNPLVWIGCNRLRQEGEQACDDAVLLSGIPAPVYAGHLLDLARNLKSSERAWSVALAMARQSHLERRFVAMLNPSLNRKKVTSLTGLLTTLAAGCLLLPLASLRAPAQALPTKLTGTVYDASGGAVPNATIIMSSSKNRTRDMTSSNAVGVFEFSTLGAGQYTFEVLKPGFARFETQVNLEPNASVNQNATLEVGSITERINVVAQGTPQATPSDSTGPPQRIRIGGNVQATKILKQVRPVYPTAAKRAGIQGSVFLEAVISREGEPMSLRVLNSQMDPDLVKASVEAVNQWRYQPTLLNGQPVEVLTRIDINFTLAP